MSNLLTSKIQKGHEFFDRYQRYINQLATISISIVIFLSLLYYYLRFQFPLRNSVPLLLFGLAYGLIALSFIKVIVCRSAFIYTKIDFCVFLFLSYNIFLLPLSFYRYGTIEGLYAIKNHLTGLLLYFAIVLFFNQKSTKFIFKLTMIVCTLVSLVYLAELVSVRYGEVNVDGDVLAGKAFNYTIKLDRYAKSIHPTGHGITKSWRKSASSIIVRLAGPLGHSNATTFVIGMGVILSFALIVFGHPQRGKTLFFIIGIVTLFWGGTRTNMISSFFGIFFLAILGILSNKIGYRKLILMFFVGTLSIIFLLSFNIIDWEAYKQIFNWRQSISTVLIIFSKSNFDTLYGQIIDNPINLIIGYGLAPVLPSTYRGVRYSGYPIVNDDAFFIQFLSQYGILLSIIFFLFIIYALWNSYKMCKQVNSEYFNKNLFAIAGITAVLILSFFSSLHGAAPFRPQINPVVFILLGAYSVIIREGIREKGRNDLFVVKRFQTLVKAPKRPTV